MNNSSHEIFLYSRALKKNCDYNMWFVYPQNEAFALSSLGYMWLFKEIDQCETIDIERIYSDKNTTRIMPNKVNLIAFSMSFDFDIAQVLAFMEKYKYNFKSKDRKETDPLIFAGGPVITANPEPYSEIFDFFVIGDGEGVNLQAAEICRQNKNKPKEEILNLLSEIEGIYVPKVSKRVIKSTKKLSQCIYTPIISENSYFKNTFIIEIERGCANRCGFCLASYINLPIRFAPYEEIISLIDLGLKHTNKIALLGAQVTAHPKFEQICEYIKKKIDNGENIEMSVSSLRIDAFTEKIVHTLVSAGQRNLTLAIEAGSERLRKLINKNITEEQIFNALEVAKNCGLRGIKIYGMLGLPTETQEDIEEIITLSKKMKERFKGLDISFGFSTFVPKAHTPFQWFGREEEHSLDKKSKYLTKELRKIGIDISVTSPKWDYYQAVLSRGDKNLTDFIINSYKLGWKTGAFKKSAKELKINTDYYAIENYSTEKELPWDFIDINPHKEFLIIEYNRLTTEHNRCKQDLTSRQNN